MIAEKEKLQFIENPEINIHPRGQSELGKLMSLSAEVGSQLLIETHSDHIFNGVRIATKEKLIKPENVVTYYFRREPFRSNSHYY